LYSRSLWSEYELMPKYQSITSYNDLIEDICEYDPPKRVLDIDDLRFKNLDEFPE